MKIKSLLLIGSFFILAKICSQDVRSLHPLFTEQTAVLIPGIEGRWRIPGFAMTITFHKAGDNFYRLQYGSELNPSDFEAVFVKINDQYFLDLSGSLPHTLGDADYRNAFIPSHAIYKVQIDKDTMHLYEVNYSWFYDFSLNENGVLKYEWLQKGMLLTLKTDALATFMKDHSGEPGLFRDPLIVISADVVSINKQPVARDNSAGEYTHNISLACTPAFPLKDGWLGGDGDVSVPMDRTTTLFIFSDSYVGNKGQKSRKEPGMKMVSNTVAVQTCLPGGRTNTRYYWSNMYTENPGPIFQSFTLRYHYWVINSFMLNGNLYAVLQKVSSKPGASPADIFSFSLLGFTLAKVSNPYDEPHDWKTDYMPLPEFSNPSMAIGPHVKWENHLYFMLSRDDKAQALVRKPFALVDDAGRPFEYYALDHSWKQGLMPGDMDTIVKGFRSNTVNYHPDLQLWVMICDVKFMDNKICMRTAKALTGPWSDEITIYEIPEVTPGNPSYHKSNFCYLARECIQYYDAKKRVMTITYDVNNSDLSAIIANPGIYTPRVIRVSLKK